MKREAARTDIIRPEDLDLLKRALEKTLPEGSTETEREFRATILVNLFKSGKRTETELVNAMLGAADDAAPGKAA